MRQIQELINRFSEAQLRVVVFCGYILLLAILHLDRAKGVFVIDDPGLIELIQSDEAPIQNQLFSGINSNRIRPVSDLLLYLTVRIFGTSYFGYWAFNITLLALAGTLIYLIIKKLSNRTDISFFAGSVFLFSNFLLYSITQVLGVMENLSLIVFLLLILSVSRFLESPTFGNFLAISAIFLLLVLSHERYVSLIPALLGLAWLSSMSTRQRLVSMLSLASPLVIHVFCKLVFLRAPILIGTGSSTQLGFTISSFLENFTFGALQLLGLNTGYSYLVGLSFFDSSLELQIIQAIAGFTSLVLTIAVLILLKRSTSKAMSFGFGIFLFSAAVLLLIGSSVTIRLEQRWLVAPLATMVVLLGSNLQLSTKFKGLVFVNALLRIFLGLVLTMNATGIFFLAASEHFKYMTGMIGEKCELNAGSVALLKVEGVDLSQDLTGWNRKLRVNGYEEIIAIPDTSLDEFPAQEYLCDAVHVLQIDGSLSEVGRE